MPGRAKSVVDRAAHTTSVDSNDKVKNTGESSRDCVGSMAPFQTLLRGTALAALVFCLVGPLGPVAAQASAEVKLMNARLPTPRGEAGVVWDGKQFLLFGGCQGNPAETDTQKKVDCKSYYDDVLSYDPGKDELKTLRAKLLTPRASGGVAWDGTHAYYFGGGSVTGPTAKFHDEILRYDPTTDSVSQMGARLPTGRAALGAVWIAPFFYLFGGVDDGIFLRKEALVDILRYDPQRDEIKKMNSVVSDSSERTIYQAATDGRLAYLPGGSSAKAEEPEALTDVRVFDPVNDTLEVRKDKMRPRGAWNYAIATDGRHVLTFGGMETPEFVGRHIRVYDTTQDGPMGPTTVALPEPRVYATAGYSGAAFFVFGGIHNGTRHSADARFVDEIVRVTLPGTIVQAPLPNDGSDPTGRGDSRGTTVNLQQLVAVAIVVAILGAAGAWAWNKRRRE